jgi:5-methylcytosine-specific restriction protein A
MPYALAKPCRYPRCPALTRERFCAVHKQQVQREYDEARGTTKQRGYGSDWQRLRKRILARDPICTWPGCTERATDVDHIVSRRKGGSEDERNLRGLCHVHHSLKTCKEDGGFTGRSAV